jgi:dUTP pyrophosphatase
MKVKIKKLDERATIPSYAKNGDAGMDLRAIRFQRDSDGNYVYYTGLAFEIPEGYVGLLFPRSSISKTSHFLRNSVGVVDSGYRGEIMFKFGYGSNIKSYRVGERVGQLIIMPYPSIEFEEVDNLSDTERGEDGFGSTGQ